MLVLCSQIHWKQSMRFNWECVCVARVSIQLSFGIRTLRSISFNKKSLIIQSHLVYSQIQSIKRNLNVIREVETKMCADKLSIWNCENFFRIWTIVVVNIWCEFANIRSTIQVFLYEYSQTNRIEISAPVFFPREIFTFSQVVFRNHFFFNSNGYKTKYRRTMESSSLST